MRKRVIQSKPVVVSVFVVSISRKINIWRWEAMTVRNANVDYCGVVNLLRDLVKRKICTKAEAKKIAAWIAVQYGADIIISL